MSHVATVEVKIKDLECLQKAAARCGLEFRQGQKTFKWFGRWVNDYDKDDAAYKHGIDPKEYGKCQHALSVVGNKSAYEIGVCPAPDGNGYVLLWDFYAGGHGLMKCVASDEDNAKRGGKGVGKLVQAYSIEVAKKQLRRQGKSVVEKKMQDGSVRLIAR